MANHVWIIPLFLACVEIIRLINTALKSPAKKKLVKRLERLILFFQIPDVLTLEQKAELEAMIGIDVDVSFFSSIFSKLVEQVTTNTEFTMGYLSKQIKKTEQISVFQTPDTVKLLVDKATIQDFLTTEMHNLPYLFFIGIWFNSLIMDEVIRVHNEEYNNGMFIIEGKGGCFMLFSILAQFDVPLETARMLILNAGRGDVDIGIVVSSKAADPETLISSICETVFNKMQQVTDEWSRQDGIIPEIVQWLFLNSPEIRNQGFQLCPRKDLMIKKDNFFFNKKVQGQQEKILYVGDNETLTFYQPTGEFVSFHLARICIGFKKDGVVHKSELCDISIVKLDDFLREETFQKLEKNAVKCPDFLNCDVYDKILSYYNRLGYNLDASVTATVRGLITNWA